MLIGRLEVMWLVPPVQREHYVKQQGQLNLKDRQGQRQKEVHMHMQRQTEVNKERHKEEQEEMNEEVDKEKEGHEGFRRRQF